jgi:two-component system, OmpR family, response regulator
VGAISLQRVLIADDEPDLLEIARIALETLGGYEVATCQSGGELLRLLPVFEPDLVVVDVLMPDMGGLEVFDALRRESGYQDLPVVFLTGLVLERDLEKLRASGAADIITKPFDPMTLADRIGRIWEGSHGR